MDEVGVGTREAAAVFGVFAGPKLGDELSALLSIESV